MVEYIISGLMVLIASISNWSYVYGNQYARNWDNIGVDALGNSYIYVEGTLTTDGYTMSNFTVMTRRKRISNADGNSYESFVIEAQGNNTKIKLLEYQLNHTQKTITEQYVKENVTIRFDKSYVTQQEYNLITTIMQSSGGQGLSESFNQGYTQGYENGITEGLDGQSEAYQAGKKEGETLGYTKGYDKAMEEIKDPYTFRNLLFAVIETPAHFIKSWLNVELLGVNVAGIIFAIFTIAVVIGIGALIKHFI